MQTQSVRRKVFVTGGTGYIGSRLIEKLVARGHVVRALARHGSEQRLPGGCAVIVGDVFSVASFAGEIGDADTLVHLVGVARPSPRKAAEFRAVDLASALAAIEAATSASVRHFVYVSVAQPAPVMRAYIEVRKEAEQRLGQSAMAATILRPWYVLGPGHRWPVLLLPLYWIGRMVPRWRASAERLGLVTITQMLAALVEAIEDPPRHQRIYDVPRIRRAAKLAS